MIVCIQFSEQFEADIFLRWMDENVGRFNEDWYSMTVIGSNISIKVTDPQKATLVALRWGLK